MKKLILLALVLTLALSLVAVPVFAKSENANGAVKADLTYHKTPIPPGEDAVVGTVILNTNASGKLIVVINIDTIPNLEDYDARIHINGTYKPIFEDVLSTNAKGNGNAQLKVDVSEFSGETIGVDVVLRQSFSPAGTFPCYTTNWPTDVIVPLK